MRQKAVLDASALICVSRKEAGHETVRDYLENSMISAVNYAEVMRALAHDTWAVGLLRALTQNLGIRIVEFDRELAEIVGTRFSLASNTLSIADQACLALGIRENLPVLTADHTWKSLDVGVEVRVFRVADFLAGS